MFSCLRRLYRVLRRLIKVSYIDIFIEEHPSLLLKLIYNDDFWRLRDSCIDKPNHKKELLYFSFLRTYGAWCNI